MKKSFLNSVDFVSTTAWMAVGFTIVLLNDFSVADEPEPVVKKGTDLKILKVDGKEPLASSYSLKKAVNFLDQTSQAWTQKHKCFTCHTNFAHLMAVADLSTQPTYYTQVKKSLDSMVMNRWPDKGPRWDAEVVMAAATLALVDRADSKKLSDPTRTALDRTWKVQRDDGGFDWLKCDWPPMESDDEYGAAIAAVAASAAPLSYQQAEPAKSGIAKLKQHIEKQGVKRLHHRGLLVWANSLGGNWITQKETQQIATEILQLQNDDGGWNTSALGKWSREDGKPADTETSDGYGTGFAVFILRKSGRSQDDPAIQKGIQWLKRNQRESGRWYTRSVSRDNKHYLTHAGTAMAIMALNSCDEN